MFIIPSACVYFSVLSFLLVFGLHFFVLLCNQTVCPHIWGLNFYWHPQVQLQAGTHANMSRLEHLSLPLAEGGEAGSHSFPVEDRGPWAEGESLRNAALERSPCDQHAAGARGSTLPGLQEEGWGEIFFTVWVHVGSLQTEQDWTNMLVSVCEDFEVQRTDSRQWSLAWTQSFLERQIEDQYHY